jgi:hypothetical protein
LHFCGPDANREIWDYVNDGYTDFGLQKLLVGFETLYPYLSHIARCNHIKDPFDSRVVEAYWIGNELLNNVDKQQLHQHYVDGLRLKDKMKPEVFHLLEDRIRNGILPNHTHHAIAVPKKMGQQNMDVTVDFMDSCRVSWGTVTEVSGPKITVRYEPIVESNNMLSLGSPIEKTIIRRLEADYDIEMLQVGQYITMHWDIPCEVLTKPIVQNLKTHTLRAIEIANVDRMTLL